MGWYDFGLRPGERELERGADLRELEGASRRCCKFSELRERRAARALEGVERRNLDNQKSLGTDASTASVAEVGGTDCGRP